MSDLEIEEKRKEVADLWNYCNGTEHYFKHWATPLVYTDGVKLFINKADGLWFVDEVALTWVDSLKNFDFITVVLMVEGGRYRIRYEDGDGRIIKKDLRSKFTDCPSGEYKFFLIDGVFLLTSEY